MTNIPFSEHEVPAQPAPDLQILNSAALQEVNRLNSLTEEEQRQELLPETPFGGDITIEYDSDLLNHAYGILELLPGDEEREIYSFQNNQRGIANPEMFSKIIWTRNPVQSMKDMIQNLSAPVIERTAAHEFMLLIPQTVYFADNLRKLLIQAGVGESVLEEVNELVGTQLDSINALAQDLQGIVTEVARYKLRPDGQSFIRQSALTSDWPLSISKE